MPRRRGGSKALVRGLGWFSIGLGAFELIAPRAVAWLTGGRNHCSLIRAFGVREIAAGVGILASGRPMPFMWARVAGDALDLAAVGKVLASPACDGGKAAVAMAVLASVTAVDVMCARELSR